MPVVVFVGLAKNLQQMRADPNVDSCNDHIQ